MPELSKERLERYLAALFRAPATVTALVPLRESKASGAAKEYGYTIEKPGRKSIAYAGGTGPTTASGRRWRRAWQSTSSWILHLRITFKYLYMQ